MTAPLHKFPEPTPEERARSKALALNIRPPQSFETFDERKAKDLLGIARTSMDNAQAILEFTDADRQTARQAGIETIAVEISALLQGERLERVLDALETSATRDKPVQLSGDGLGVLRRLERLAAEAGRNLALYAQTSVTSARRRAEPAAIPEFKEGQTVASLAGPELSRTGTPLVIRLEGPVMAQMDRASGKSGWDPLAVVGMFALGAAVLLTIAVVASRD